MRQRILNEMQKDICKFVTCGSVDDGKSTLIGRILYESNSIPLDERLRFEKENKDFASLVDGLSSEREQGITIDVAYRYFSTNKKRYIISDSPGHEQYTRNMVTASSNADVAIILIDSRNGVLQQTIRHLFIVALLGIKKVIVAINKMDLITQQQECFEKIKKDFKSIVQKIDQAQEMEITYIPISALLGINIVHSKGEYPWYLGKSILETLDDIILDKNRNNFRFPIQYVNRHIKDARGFCGTISGGEICIGEEVTLLPSKQKSKISKIISSHTQNLYPHKAQTSEAVTLILEDEIDISRGDILIKSNQTMDVSNSFLAYLIWFDETDAKLETDYILKRSSTSLIGKISEVIFKKDISTLSEIKSQEIKINDIAFCRIVMEKKIPLDCYEANKEMGSFILIDRHTNKTVGAGLISQIETANEGGGGCR